MSKKINPSEAKDRLLQSNFITSPSLPFKPKTKRGSRVFDNIEKMVSEKYGRRSDLCRNSSPMQSKIVSKIESLLPNAISTKEIKSHHSSPVKPLFQSELFPNSDKLTNVSPDFLHGKRSASPKISPALSKHLRSKSPNKKSLTPTKFSGKSPLRELESEGENNRGGFENMFKKELERIDDQFVFASEKEMERHGVGARELINNPSNGDSIAKVQKPLPNAKTPYLPTNKVNSTRKQPMTSNAPTGMTTKEVFRNNSPLVQKIQGPSKPIVYSESNRLMSESPVLSAMTTIDNSEIVVLQPLICESSPVISRPISARKVQELNSGIKRNQLNANTKQADRSQVDGPFYYTQEKTQQSESKFVSANNNQRFVDRRSDLSSVPFPLKKMANDSEVNEPMKAKYLEAIRIRQGTQALAQSEVHDTEPPSELMSKADQPQKPLTSERFRSRSISDAQQIQRLRDTSPDILHLQDSAEMPARVRQKTPNFKSRVQANRQPKHTLVATIDHLSTISQSGVISAIQEKPFLRKTTPKNPQKLLLKKEPISQKPRLEIPLDDGHPSDAVVLSLNCNSKLNGHAENNLPLSQISDQRKSLAQPNPQPKTTAINFSVRIMELENPKKVVSSHYVSVRSRSITSSKTVSTRNTMNLASLNPKITDEIKFERGKITVDNVKITSIRPNLVNWIIDHSNTIPSLPDSKSIGPFASFIQTIGYNSHQGKSRPYNEDRIAIHVPSIKKDPKIKSKGSRSSQSVLLCSIFDGHGGDDCSQFLNDMLHEQLLNEIDFELKELEEPIKRVYRNIDNQYLKRCAQMQTSYSGSCAVTVCITPSTIYTINVGDSRAIMSIKNGKEIVELSHDHKPESASELRRIFKAGGQIYRSIWNPKIKKTWDEYANNVQEFKKLNEKTKEKSKLLEFGPWRISVGGLSVARSIGDFESKIQALGAVPGCLICEPEVTEFNFADADFIVIGC